MKTKEWQSELMLFDPAFGTPAPYPSHAKQWRIYHGGLAWLFNPWSGSKRHPGDIGNDIGGLLIRPSPDSVLFCSTASKR